MRTTPWLVATLIMTVAATGCLQADTQPTQASTSTFALVTIEGEIIEEGPERNPHACGRPAWSAGLAIEDPQGLTLQETHMPTDGIKLATWDAVEAVHAGNWTACEWPLLSLSPDDQQPWTAQHRDYNRTFNLQRDEDTLRVHETLLNPGENTTVQIEHDPNDTNYTYHGHIEFTFHGLWSDDKLTLVESEDDIRGWHGVVKDW